LPDKGGRTQRRNEPNYALAPSPVDHAEREHHRGGTPRSRRKGQARKGPGASCLYHQGPPTLSPLPSRFAHRRQAKARALPGPPWLVPKGHRENSPTPSALGRAVEGEQVPKGRLSPPAGSAVPPGRDHSGGSNPMLSICLAPIRAACSFFC
jgi:hypothetical protein